MTKKTAKFYRVLWRCAALLGTVTLLGTSATAQELKRGDTFFVTLQEKTEAHRYFGIGSKYGLAINGEESKELIVEREVSYTFILRDIPEEMPFFFAEHAKAIKEWFGGVEPGNYGVGNDTLIFTPPDYTPDTVYYANFFETYTGGPIVVVDSITSGVDDQNHYYLSERILSAHAAPNPFHSSTEISFDLELPSSVAMEIVDVVGRVVYSSEGEWMEAGRRTVTVRGENLPNGVLLYRITALAGERRKIYTGRIIRE